MEQENINLLKKDLELTHGMLEEEKENLEKVTFQYLLLFIKLNLIFFHQEIKSLEQNYQMVKLLKLKYHKRVARPFKVIHSQIFVNGCLN